MVNIIYNIVIVVLFPVWVAYYLWRVLVSGQSRASWRENLGHMPLLCNRPPAQKLVWIHAVSVGEVVASLTIQDEIRRIMPDAFILVTTITKTGNDIACKSAKFANAVSYLPMDYPFFINRAFSRIRPDALVLMEAEIWPNLLATARRRRVPMVLANGRITDKAMHSGPIWRWLGAWAYANIDHCCMQTEDDAERIRSLGAHPDAVQVTGNTKFDQEGSHLAEKAVLALKTDLGIGAESLVFVAGSTNPGEDEPMLSAFQTMRDSMPGLQLILAPRQTERGAEIRTMAENRHIRCAQRSRERVFAPETDVLILDTLGELAKVYAVGDITFVGGTLVPKGGHSIVQPILQGKPVFFGPHTFKTRDIAEMAISAGVGFEIKDADELAELGSALLDDPERRKSINDKCRQLAADNGGASLRCAEIITQLMKREAVA